MDLSSLLSGFPRQQGLALSLYAALLLVACSDGSKAPQLQLDAGVTSPDAQDVSVDLGDEETPVGELCTVPSSSSGSVVFTQKRDVAVGSVATASFRDGLKIYLGWEQVEDPGCSPTYVGDTTSFSLALLEPRLGVHILPAALSSDFYDEVSSGEIDIRGYDPVSGILCGNFDIEFSDDTRAAGDFQAVVQCLPSP